MNLIKIGNDMFIIDIEVMGNFITEQNQNDKSNGNMEVEKEIINTYSANSELIGKQETIHEKDKGREINVSKYEIIRTMIDTVMSYNEEIDNSLGIDRAMKQAPIPFKIAFNTLLYYKILKRINI